VEQLAAGRQALQAGEFGCLPVQFSGQYEYDFADDKIGAEHTIRFNVKFLFPK